MLALYLVIVSALLAISAYRTYGAFLAAPVATLDDLRMAPAHARRDGRDYVPTNRWVRRWSAGVRGRSIADPAPNEPMPEAAV